MEKGKEVKLSATDRRLIARQVAEAIKEEINQGLDELLSVKQAANFLDRSVSWVRLHQADLGAVYLGEHPYFSKHGLIKMAQSRSGLGKGWGMI
mgnify:CR=1 FL=1